LIEEQTFVRDGEINPADDLVRHTEITRCDLDARLAFQLSSIRRCLRAAFLVSFFRVEGISQTGLTRSHLPQHFSAEQPGHFRSFCSGLFFLDAVRQLSSTHCNAGN
jgi:hypothetical protein